MKICKADEFVLKKLKTNNGGLMVHFNYSFANGGNSHQNDVPLNSTLTPHPDLTKLLEALKPYVARMFYFNSSLTISEVEAFKATKKQKEYLETMYNEMLEKIEITGITLSGAEATQQCNITAKFETENGTVAINPKGIKLGGTKYGFEEDIDDICTELINEAFKYVMEQKSGEPKLFSAAEEAGQGSEVQEEKQAS
jgi:hypothetical protein